MKLFQVLLLNVATVAIALVVYDQFRSRKAGASRTSTRSGVADGAALDQRLRALEAERTTRAETVARAVEQPDEPAASPEPTPDEAREIDRPADQEDTGEPTASEILRFRRLQAAVRREEALARSRLKVDRALSKLSFNLTERQRERIHVAFAAFEPRVKEIWTEVKTEAQETIAAGGEVDRGDIVSATTTRIQTEFAETITGIVPHQADADAVAKTLMPGGR